MGQRTYREALHAMQSGVAFDQGSGSDDGSPKHLRVGINASKADQCGLAQLLIKKGIFTNDEYIEAITASMNAEVERYERYLSERFGKVVKLG